MHPEIQSFTQNHQLPNEELVAYDHHFGQTLILTDKRVVFIEKMKWSSLGMMAMSYSDIASVEQKLTTLKIHGKTSKIVFTGKQMHFLGKAIQQIKFDPASYRAVQVSFKESVPQQVKTSPTSWKWLKYSAYIFIGLPVVSAVIGVMFGPQPSSPTIDPEANTVGFAEPEQLEFYTRQCEQAFRKAEHFAEHTEHEIIQATYYSIPDHNQWHFQVDGSDIALTGTMSIKNSLYKRGHEKQENVFFCGIDRASGKINYLNSTGYEKDVSRLGEDGIQRRPVELTAAMKEYEAAQERELQQSIEDDLKALYDADCYEFVRKSYPQAEFRLLGSRDVQPRRNSSDNWVTAISWVATNAFGVEVHNRTWCEYDGESGNRIAYETETLKYEK